jgi:hypothetical protein
MTLPRTEKAVKDELAKIRSSLDEIERILAAADEYAESGHEEE